jgi:hypothetical protein
VNAVAAKGADAYTTSIDFATSSTVDSYPLFLIHFHDQFRQDLTWQFVGEMASLASGESEVQRAVDAEHLLWRFDTPTMAKNGTFETGVNLIAGGGEQANCTGPIFGSSGSRIRSAASSRTSSVGPNETG